MYFISAFFAHEKHFFFRFGRGIDRARTKGEEATRVVIKDTTRAVKRDRV